jgi:hypothetical protein
MIDTISRRTKRKARFMLTFSHRHAIHRTVLVTLGAWVLVLMAGIANACVLHDRVAGHDGQVQAIDLDAPEADCGTAWEAGAFTIAKQESRDGTSFGPAAVQTVGVAPNTVFVPMIARSVDTGVAPRGLPGAIRFLRLRL